MADKSKPKKQKIIPDEFSVLRAEFVDEYIDEFLNLIYNSVKIKGLKFTDELYVKQLLFGSPILHLSPPTGGRVGYDKSLDLFAAVAGEDFTDTGFPKRGIFTTANGNTWTRELSYEPTDDGAYIIYAYPSKSGLYSRVVNVAELCADISISIVQNVIATRTPDIVVVEDPELALSIKTAVNARKRGEPVIAVTTALVNSLKGIKNETPIIFDRLIQLRKEVRNDFLSQIGVLSANTDKRERVQSAEISAGIGEVVDSIYIPIDTFNRQCEQYGLFYEMEINSVVEDYYGIDEQDGGERPAENLLKEV